VALKACGLAAQGLWMRMLCIAAQHDPTGYVSVNRVGLDPEGIARIVGAGVDEVRSLIGELSLNGVFARDQHGVIYNRRMLRDEKKAAVARKNGKLGGNPMLCNNSDVNSPDKGMDKAGLKGGFKLKPLPIPKEKDSFYQDTARSAAAASPARGSRSAALPGQRKRKRLSDEKELEKLKKKYAKAPPVSSELLASLASTEKGKP
jgi:hypothetical protein